MRKIFLSTLMLVFMLLAVGCGGGDDKPADTDKKAATAVEGTADKAVLAYAQLYAYGVPDDDALKAAGLTEKDIEEVQQQVIEPLLQSFSEYPLSDENVQSVTTQYISKLQTVMDIKAKIKTDDAEKPVVELTATTIDTAGASKVAETNEDLLALGMALGELESQGFTVEQLKENDEFQKAALEAIDNFINEFPLNAEATIDVPCEMVQGSDGKVHWGPSDPAAIAKFVTAQK